MFGKRKQQGNHGRDWAVEATDSIEKIIDNVRDKAVVPLTTVARAIVFGLLAGIVGMGALVLMIIGTVRLLDVYLDNIPGVPENVWFAYLVMGGLFIVVGLLLWGQRSPKKADSKR